MILVYTDLMAEIYIGTSGYSYPDWRGVFYPEEMKNADFLSFYSRRFGFTELNFTYYRQPEPEQCRNFLHQTPPEFLFTLKAHQSLTHRRGPGWKDEAAVFREGIQPLAETRRLGAVILQFPYSFGYTRENRLYLARLLERLEGLPLAVEFRKKEWQNPAVRAGLKERETAEVITDSPRLPGLPETQMCLTSDWGCLRFHGRNADNWWDGDNVSRYDYRYSRPELEEWVGPITELARKTRRLFIAFNNHRKGQAVENALTLRGLLEEEALEVMGPSVSGPETGKGIDLLDF